MYDILEITQITQFNANFKRRICEFFGVANLRYIQAQRILQLPEFCCVIPRGLKIKYLR